MITVDILLDYVTEFVQPYLVYLYAALIITIMSAAVGYISRLGGSD